MNQEQLHYRVTGDAKGFKGAIRQSQNSLNGFQSQIKSAASSLKVLMVGGLGIAAAQALRSAKTFDQSMTQIKSLVGIAGNEVDKMGEVAIEMATKTGKSANEAAEALFFITSAGLRGSEAMQVLEASLKAASVGLGETKTVADLATSALNAYGAENLSATDATDVMVTAVREGKLEASELAQSMGRVLPLASAMGVEFHEVGAAFAALSRTGTNAAEASTQVRGILASLLKPTKQAEEALKGMDLSAEGLRKQLREKGLLSTLKTLQQNFEGNEDAAAQVFGNIRALSGVLDLMGANAEGTAKIFDALTESVGATNTAFEVASESVSKKLDKALAKLSNSTIPPAKNALLGIVNATNGIISAFEILGDVGGPSGDLKRQIDANKKSLDEFAISGKEAAKEIKNLFSAQTLFGQDIDLEKTEDTLLKNILSYERTEDKKKKDISLTEEQQKVLDNLDKSLLDITNRNIVFGDEIDVTSEKIMAYQEAMVGLLNAGMQPTATAFKNLSTEVNILNESLLESDLLAGRYSEVTNQSTKSSQEFSDSIASVNAGFTDLDTFVMTGVDLGSLFENATSSAEKLKDATEVLNEGFKQIAFTVASSFLSMALASDKSIREIVNNLAKMVAQMTAALILQTALRVMMGDLTAGPQLAATLGKAAAIMVGAGMISMVTKPKEFATGGIVTSPMMGIVGEAGDEAIIPLHRLPQLMQQSQGKQTGEFILRGQDLILALERSGDFRARITG